MKVGAESVKSFMVLLANRDTEMRLGSWDKKRIFILLNGWRLQFRKQICSLQGVQPFNCTGGGGPLTQNSLCWVLLLGFCWNQGLRLSSFDRTFCEFVTLISFGSLSGFFSLVEQPESWDYKPPPGSWGMIPVFGVLVLQESWLGSSWKLNYDHRTEASCSRDSLSCPQRSLVSVKSGAAKHVPSREAVWPQPCVSSMILFSLDQQLGPRGNWMTQVRGPRPLQRDRSESFTALQFLSKYFFFIMKSILQYYNLFCKRKNYSYPHQGSEGPDSSYLLLLSLCDQGPVP